MNKQLFMQYGIELFITILAGLILYKIQTKKPKLVSYLTNITSFFLPGPPPLTVGTHSITIQNNGRGVAEDIEVCHSQLPLINVFPDTRYNVEETPQGSKIIKFERLLPKQMITISYLYINAPNSTLFFPMYAKSKEMNAKIIRTFHSPVYSKKLQYAVVILLFSGSMFLLNLIYELLKLILQ